MWDGKRLVVSKEFCQSVEAYGKIKLLVLYCLRWYNWSETRWLGVRKSAQFYIRSLILGGEAIAKLVVEDPNESTWHLLGHSRSSAAVRRYFVLARVSAYPAEMVHLQLLTDDRLLELGAKIREEVPKAMNTISSSPDLLWQGLAFIVGPCVAGDLEHDCTQAALICCGYLETDVFSALDRVPFSLTQGNIEDNIRHIGEASLEDILDDISRKIKCALDLGIHPRRLEDGLKLLRNAPCSVTTVEQSHASGAVLLRDHCLYNESSLVDRSTLHPCRHLLMPDACDKAVAKLEASMVALNTKQPAKISARNMFFKLRAAQRTANGFGADDVAQCMREQMVAHATDWDGLPRRDILRFEREAKKRRLLTFDQLVAKRSEIDDETASMLASRDDRFKQRGIPNHFDSCRLSTSDLGGLVQQLHDPERDASASLEHMKWSLLLFWWRDVGVDTVSNLVWECGMACEGAP